MEGIFQTRAIPGGWGVTAAESEPAGTLDARIAFENLYVAAWPRLYRYAWLLVRHREDAEDVASETVRRACGAWQEGRRPIGDPIPWLFLIARRIVIDRNRRRVLPWLALPTEEDPPATKDPVSQVEAAIWFDELREHLSPHQHEAIVLRFLFDLGDDQIGRIMGVSAAGVRTHVSRGLAVLRKRPEALDR
jgi:RNA polymerase sigma factor (sigma-70 family)